MVRNIYLCVSILLSGMIALTPMVVLASTSVAAPSVIITEVQTANDTAGQEFIELYNASDAEIDLSDSDGTKKLTWKLQFFSGAKVSAATFGWGTTSATSTISLTGKIAPHEYYLLSTTGYVPGNTDPDQTYSARMANEGGGIQLVTVGVVDKKVTAIDHAGWLTEPPSGSLWNDFLHPHSAHGSWQRQMNSDAMYLNDQGSITALVDTTAITPKAAWQVEPTPVEVEEDPVIQEPPAETPGDVEVPVDMPLVSETNTDNTPTPIPEVPAVVLLPPIITELLPNPKSPASDDTDEYVELYNPNEQSFDLHGYVLESGTKNSYHFDLDGTAIPAKGYVSVLSGSSSISLANSGGHARLLDATGVVISQSAEYADAPEGEAWALFDGAWKWTTSPTLSGVNVLTVPLPPAVKAAIPKASPKPKPKAAATAAKPKVLAASAAKKPTTATKTAAKTADSQPAQSKAVPPIHTSILVVAGVLAVGYALYEYRTDIANRYHQFSRNRAARRAARSSATRR